MAKKAALSQIRRFLKSRGGKPLYRVDDSRKQALDIFLNPKYGDEAGMYEGFKPQGVYWADDVKSAVHLDDPYTILDTDQYGAQYLKDLLNEQKVIRGVANADARVKDVYEGELKDLYQSYKPKYPTPEAANRRMTQDLAQDYDFVRIMDPDQEYGPAGKELIQLVPDKVTAFLGPHMRKMALAGALGAGAAAAGFPGDAEAASLKDLKRLGLPVPKSMTGESAVDVLSKELRGSKTGQKYISLNDWTTNPEAAGQQVSQDVRSFIVENPQAPVAGIKRNIKFMHDQGLTDLKEDAYKASLQLMDPMELERLVQPKQFKELMDWAKISQPKNQIRGLVPLATATGLAFMTPDGEAQAMPVSRAVAYNAKTAKHILGTTSSQHDDAWRILGEKIQMKLPRDEAHQAYEVADMLTNHRDAWHMIVKDEAGKQFAVPLTKQEFKLFMQASGTRQKLQEFKGAMPEVQDAMAKKSLGRRETERAVGPAKLRRELASMEERQVDIVRKLAPDLVNDYVMFKSKGSKGPSVYIPEAYARKLVGLGLGRITKIMRNK